MDFKYYNIQYHVDYSTTDEYRYQIQRIFFMDVENLVTETDEIAYDDEAIKSGLEFILNQTKDSPLFVRLYEKAAEIVLSDNLEMGLAILFSYDYLNMFHSVLYIYFFEPENFVDTNPTYIELFNKIKR